MEIEDFGLLGGRGREEAELDAPWTAWSGKLQPHLEGDVLIGGDGLRGSRKHPRIMVRRSELVDKRKGLVHANSQVPLRHVE